MVGRSFFARRTRGCGWVVPFLVVSTTSVATLISGSAVGQEDPRKGQSTPIFEEGLKLADRGKNAEALAKFRESYAVYPSPNTLFNIGRTEHLLGKPVEALRDYREAVKNPILNPQMVERGKKYIAELEKVVGRVEVTGPGGQFVVVNGVEYILPLKAPLDVEAGRVVVKGEGIERTADVGAGELVKVDVSPETSESAPASSSKAQGTPAPLVEPPREREEGFWTTRHTLGVVSAGLAVAGAALGTGLLLAREGHVSDAEDAVRANPGLCTVPSSAACTSYEDSKSSANAAGTGALISYIAAGAFGVGAVVLLWPSGESKSTTGQVRVTPFGTGLSFSGSF